MTDRIKIANIQIAQCLHQFIEKDVLPGTNVSSKEFWQGLSDLVDTLAPKNKALLNVRDEFQQKIDQWHLQNNGSSFDFSAYKQFLTDINYLVDDVPDFKISTTNVDEELATLAGPQLVVPVMNARFALNAVNARWGSLYDALYGSDVIEVTDNANKSDGYNPIRGKKVVEFGRNFLDQAFPLTLGRHSNVIAYYIENSKLTMQLGDGSIVFLKDASALLGFTGDKQQPKSLVLKRHGLHIEILFDSTSPISKADAAGMSDILVESALTTIMDCEDSVAAVDAEDKVIAYKNWLGLNKGELSATINKNGRSITRTMNGDKKYTDLHGEVKSLKSRSLMFVRNVGHLMTNNAILDKNNNEIPEGILDALVTSAIALHDINKDSSDKNSTQGSIYIVKPKMHGPDEVAFANTLFNQVEDILSLPRHTLKMGIMDEERRTSVNLKACIYAAKERVVFINTGFLDRTGDEIHTSMQAGVMARKAEIKLTPWIAAYENSNVDIGLICGFSGKAQIGKGMWPIPDQMANMLATKINHVEAGANTAWVPSPTAATLHALHYHRVNVFELQKSLAKREPANVDDILTIPLAQSTDWSAQEISDELDNNAQGILGYVVRWIDQGIGCSKVPDINDIGLMEDRATLRISSQHMANWLLHGICTKEDVMASMKKMAVIVDDQNSADNVYQRMSTNFDTSIAFQAACKLVFDGINQPNGYTEPLLHQYRIEKKQEQS